MGSNCRGRARPAPACSPLPAADYRAPPPAGYRGSSPEPATPPSLAPLLPWLLSGLALGVSGGLSPGPLTVLVLTQTLRHGLREGARVAIAPLLTDGPLIVLSTLVVGALARLQGALGVLSLVGAVVLCGLAWHTARVSAIALPAGQAPAPRSIRTAVLTNLVNPHPYLFWLTIGGPMVVQARATSDAAAAMWALGFFGGLVGSKLVLATVVDRLRSTIAGPGLRWTMRLLAAILLGFAATFLHHGGRVLGWW